MKPIIRIFSWLAVGFLILLSFVPLRILLFISPLFAFFVGKVFGYRKEVITTNLANSFPDKSNEEIAALRGAFYLHLADMFFETVSLFSASERAIRKRCIADPNGLALMESLYSKGRLLICFSGHLGNWEYHMPAYSGIVSYQIIGVYRPLREKAFDWFIAAIRRRFSESLVHDRRVARTLVRLRGEETATAIGLVADQSPGSQDIAWLDFLNQDTAVYTGPERLARMFKQPAIFMYTRKETRGRYRVYIELITDHPEELPEGEVTRLFFERLEREIRLTPAHYLWSHRRWKKKR